MVVRRSCQRSNTCHSGSGPRTSPALAGPSGCSGSCRRRSCRCLSAIGPVGAARADLGRPGAVKGQCAGGRGGDREQRRQCHEDRQAAGSRDSRGSHVRVPVSDGPGRHPASRPGGEGIETRSIPASPAGLGGDRRHRWSAGRTRGRLRACETPTWCDDAPDATAARPATIVADAIPADDAADPVVAGRRDRLCRRRHASCRRCRWRNGSRASSCCSRRCSSRASSWCRSSSRSSTARPRPTSRSTAARWRRAPTATAPATAAATAEGDTGDPSRPVSTASA